MIRISRSGAAQAHAISSRRSANVVTCKFLRRTALSQRDFVDTHTAGGNANWGR